MAKTKEAPLELVKDEHNVLDHLDINVKSHTKLAFRMLGGGNRGNGSNSAPISTSWNYRDVIVTNDRILGSEGHALWACPFPNQAIIQNCIAFSPEVIEPFIEDFRTRSAPQMRQALEDAKTKGVFARSKEIAHILTGFDSRFPMGWSFVTDVKEKKHGHFLISLSHKENPVFTEIATEFRAEGHGKVAGKMGAASQKISQKVIGRYSDNVQIELTVKGEGKKGDADKLAALLRGAQQ